MAMSDSSPWNAMEGFSGAARRGRSWSEVPPYFHVIEHAQCSAPATGAERSKTARRSMAISKLCNKGVVKMPSDLRAYSPQDKHASDDEVDNSTPEDPRQYEREELCECPSIKHAKRIKNHMRRDKVRARRTGRRRYNRNDECLDEMSSLVEVVKTLIDEVKGMQNVKDDSVKRIRDYGEEKHASITCEPTFIEVSSSDLEKATETFHDTVKIGEGLFGTVYQGSLGQTPVVVKVLQSCDGMPEFCDEVKVLGRLRHPNLVALLGTCCERRALIYEFVPNGNLEDHLSNEKKSWMLSWQARVRIAYEVCSALMSLHSSKPQIIVHGDLKPANILLDENLVSKLSDYGVYTLFRNPTGSPSSQPCLGRNAIYAAAPECHKARWLSPQSDVYCFGVVLLRLLTRKPAIGISQKVKAALSNGSLPKLVDPTAGFWPLDEAKLLASLGVMCCATDPHNRPDLAQDVWGVIAPMATSVWQASLTPSPEHTRRMKHGQASLTPSPEHTRRMEHGWCCLPC